MKQFVATFACMPLAVSGMLLSVPAHSTAVYKWVDATGVTWFSEAPPAAELASIEVTRVTLDSYSPEATGDLQSVLDVANSIQASRLERERARREKQKLMLERLQLQQQSQSAGQSYNNSYGVWYAPPYYHRPVRPRPPHVKPPAEPPHGTPPGRVTLGR